MTDKSFFVAPTLAADVIVYVRMIHRTKLIGYGAVATVEGERTAYIPRSVVKAVGDKIEDDAYYYGRVVPNPKEDKREEAPFMVVSLDPISTVPDRAFNDFTL